MNATTVVTLVVILQDDFPVCPYLIRNLLRHTQVVQGIALKLFWRTRQLREKCTAIGRSLFWRQIHKYESTPNLKPHRVQGKFLLLEISLFPEKRRALQSSVQSVSPLMIGAANGSGGGNPSAEIHVPFVFTATQTGTAMPANVVVGF